MNNKKIFTHLAATLLACTPVVSAVADQGPVPVEGTNFTINVVDLIPALGFDDPTPVNPVGGNPGTTVGEQRLEAYKQAARIWQAELAVDQQVVIQAIFFPLSCSPTSGVLGAAGTLTVFRDFGGASFPSTWYAAALANELSGFDLGGTAPDPGFQAPPFNDEIFSLFNSSLGTPECLSNSAWYYGLDGENPAGTIDFLAVLTHEVGHGLGFQNFADDETGENFLGFPDQWSRFQRDNVLFGKNWDQMIDIERAFSATNGPNLVWTGPNVTAEAPSVLGPALVVSVNEPASIAGAELPFGTASFGPAVPAGGLTADLMLANDGVGAASDACEPIANDVAGKIALIDRGSCAFVLKAQNAEAAGAIGVIIANNQPGDSPIGLGGSGPVGIPTVSVTLDDGQLLRLFPGTNVTVGAPAADGSLSGADANGLVKLYAPFPAQPGSSVAHFDVSATPNLLMEPFISGDLDPADEGVDLTNELLNDIGWDGTVSCPVDSDSRATVNIFGCETGVENRRGNFVLIPKKTWLPGQNVYGSVAGGCYVADTLNACLPVLGLPGQGGQYQSCITKITTELKDRGALSDWEAGAIRSCSAKVTQILN